MLKHRYRMGLLEFVVADEKERVGTILSKTGELVGSQSSEMLQFEVEVASLERLKLMEKEREKESVLEDDTVFRTAANLSSGKGIPYRILASTIMYQLPTSFVAYSGGNSSTHQRRDLGKH